jgi:hypothetical protein
MFLMNCISIPDVLTPNAEKNDSNSFILIIPDLEKIPDI